MGARWTHNDHHIRSNVESECASEVETDDVSAGRSRSAQQYLKIAGFSRQGLIDQCSSEFGETFSVEEASFAVDNLGVDWNVEAVQSANSFLKTSGYSCQRLIDQLSSKFGEKFTAEEARYSATQIGLC
jgi:colicin import membrane protein